MHFTGVIEQAATRQGGQQGRLNAITLWADRENPDFVSENIAPVIRFTCQTRLTESTLTWDAIGRADAAYDDGCLLRCGTATE
jgi:hypothetical protein